jgi:hypothetical protein
MQCPYCQTLLAITPDLMGRSVACPTCGGIFAIPSAATAVSKDLSGTDSRAVIGLVCAAVSTMGFLFCIPIAVLLPIAGFVSALFARPSISQLVALLWNAIVLVLAIGYFVWAFTTINRHL